MEKIFLSLALVVSMSGVHAMRPELAINIYNNPDGLGDWATGQDLCLHDARTMQSSDGDDQVSVDSAASMPGIPVAEAEESEKQQEEQEDTEWAIRLKRFKTDLFEVREYYSANDAFEKNRSRELFDAVMNASDSLGIARAEALDAMLMQMIVDCPLEDPDDKRYRLHTAMAALLVSEGANPGVIVPNSQGNNLLQVTLNEIVRQLDKSHDVMERFAEPYKKRKKTAWEKRDVGEILSSLIIGRNPSDIRDVAHAFKGFSREGVYCDFTQCRLLEILLGVDVPIDYKNEASLTLRDMLHSIKKSKYSYAQELQEKMIDHFDGCIGKQEHNLKQINNMLLEHVPAAHASLVCEYLNLITSQPAEKQIEERNHDDKSQNKHCKDMTQNLHSCSLL